MNGPTTQTATLTLYDSPNSAGCVAANAIVSAVTLAANAVLDVQVPVVNGLWYILSGAPAGPLTIVFS